MTVLEKKNKRGWTEQEAKDFVEVERLKELWYPGPEVSTGEALANLRDFYNTAYSRIERENEERRLENEQRKQERLLKIKEENKNLEWPKPKPDSRLKNFKTSDYWKNGCLYCGYKPKRTHDYEVHIVTKHPGRPAYPGPADVELYGLKLE